MQALAVIDPSLKDVDGLTYKQRAFCNHYIELNSKPQPVARRGFGAEACRRAGYQGDDDALSQAAFYNLRLPKIREYIRKQVSLIAMPADEVLQRLGKQARADIAQVLNEDGSFDFSKAKAKGNTDLIRKLKTRTITRNLKDGETETEVIHELELHNAQTALELVGKHHRLFGDAPVGENAITVNIARQDITIILQSSLSEALTTDDAIDVTPPDSRT